MSAQTQVHDTVVNSPSQAMPERTAWYLPGVPMLVFDLVLLAAAIVAFWQASLHQGGAAVALRWTGAVLIVAAVGVFRGLTPVAPGRAHVVQLFGRYQGTVQQVVNTGSLYS